MTNKRIYTKLVIDILRKAKPRAARFAASTDVHCKSKILKVTQLVQPQSNWEGSDKRGHCFLPVLAVGFPLSLICPFDVTGLKELTVSLLSSGTNSKLSITHFVLS